MKKWISALMVVILLLATVACAKAPVPSPSPAPMPVPAPIPAPASMPPGQEEVVYKDGALPSIEEERMIVRTGDMSLVVDDVVDARDEIVLMTERFDGFVVSSWISGEGEEKRGRISIRVPDDKFEMTLSELRSLAVRVKSESTNSQDVTEQYVDLQARLKNAEATENQYLTLLEKAEEVEDILRIYDSLSRVRYEIEHIKGQMQYLERTTSMSLISVNLEPAATARGLVRAGWSALEALKSAVRGIVIFGQWLGTIAIWLLIFSPIWGAIVGVIYWRHRRKRKAAS